MRRYKILENDFAFSHVVEWKNLDVVKSLDEVNVNDLMLMGGDILRHDVRSRLTLKQPTIFMHRGYLGNHLYKQRKWWRYSVNGFANTRLLTPPHSRWNLLELPKHPWKVKEVKKVLIAPSKMTGKIWNPELDTGWAESMIDKFPGAEVRIRPKGPKPGIRWLTLWEDFDWADLVVSQASAITAEAFWYGKKVISLHPCPTWAATHSTLDNWEDPKEPELREAWHEHLAWSQFTNEEWQTGKALELIDQYIGPIENYDPEHLYSFNK